jgi:hypothetical protein
MRLLKSSETEYKLNKELKQTVTHKLMTVHSNVYRLGSDNSINIVTTTMMLWEKYKLIFLRLIIIKHNFK